MEILFLYVCVFIAGLFFGSFFNLVADRVVKGEQILKGRSKCDHCKKSLGPKNLVPLLSYLFQKGKCSKCKKPLNFYYPLSEVLSGLAFAYALYTSGLAGEMTVIRLIIFTYVVGVLAFYLILFLTDAKYRLIPDKIVIPAIVFTLVFSVGLFAWRLYSQYTYLQNDGFGKYLIEAGYWHLQYVSAMRGMALNLACAFGIALFFYSLVAITHGRGMGGGDIRLGFLIGLFNGFPHGILAVFLGFVLGAVYSIVLMLFRRKTLKDTIAFGPFLIIGSLIAFEWGPVIMNWYFNLF